MCEHREFLVIATLKAARSYSGGGMWRNTHTHTNIHVCIIDIYICVYYICVCMYLQKRCYRVLHQKPLTLNLLWMIPGLSHYEFLINQPDYTLPLCVWLTAPTRWLTATCLSWTSSSWQWIWMWKDRTASPLVAGNGITVSYRGIWKEQENHFTFLYLYCALKDPRGKFFILLLCQSSEPKKSRRKNCQCFLWRWSYWGRKPY